VPEALGKSPYTHGKLFDVCDQRRTAHGKCGDSIKPLCRPPVTLSKKRLTNGELKAVTTALSCAAHGKVCHERVAALGKTCI